MAQYPPFTASGTADASGNLTLTYQPRSAGLVRVTQVTAEMPTGAGAICSVRRNGALVSPMVPTGDAAAGDPPIWLWPGDELTAQWAGAPAGATGSMVVFFDYEAA